MRRDGSWIEVAVDFPTPRSATLSGSRNGDGDWAAKDLVVSFEVSEPPRLVNDRLAAEFGDRGLVALVERDTAAPYRFRRDDFAVVVGGARYDSRTLPLPTRTLSPERVTYTWATGQASIDVMYELQRDWRFLSKQIAIRSTRPAIRVEQ